MTDEEYQAQVLNLGGQNSKLEEQMAMIDALRKSVPAGVHIPQGGIYKAPSPFAALANAGTTALQGKMGMDRTNNKQQQMQLLMQMLNRKNAPPPAPPVGPGLMPPQNPSGQGLIPPQGMPPQPQM